MKFIRNLLWKNKKKQAIIDTKKSFEKEDEIKTFFKQNPKLEKEFNELVDSGEIFEKYKRSGIKCSTYIINIEREKFYKKYNK